MTLPGHRFADCVTCDHAKADHDPLAPQCSHVGCICLRYRPKVPAAPRVQSPIPAPVKPAPVSELPSRPEPSSPPPVAARAVQPTAPLERLPEPTDDEPFRAGKGPTIEQVLQAGKRSEHKRTVALTEKIAELVHDLRGRLTDERRAAEEKQQREAAEADARREIADLEAKLQAARSRLAGRPAKPKNGRVVHVPRDGGEHACPDCGKTFGTPQGCGAHRFRAHGYRTAG